MSVPVYQTTWHHILEACHLKSHLNMFVSVSTQEEATQVTAEL